MANEHEPRSPGEKSPIDPPDPLVERLVPDPSQPPTPTVSLLGLLGRSTKEGYWRLYFSSSLGRYAEFKEEDVLHSVKIPREQPSLAGLQATRVWIRQDAEVEYTRHESRRVQAEFLQGGLAEGFSERGSFFSGVLMTPIVYPTEVCPPELLRPITEVCPPELLAPIVTFDFDCAPE